MNPKQKLLSLLTITAAVITATVFHAEAGDDHRESHGLVGTWIGTGVAGVAPGLLSFLSNGRLIWSRPPTVLTPPAGYALVGTGQGEWVRTGNHEFSSTTFFLSSDTTHEFTVLIKNVNKIKLNRRSDEFTQTGTVSGFDPEGTLIFSFPNPITNGKRVVAE